MNSTSELIWQQLVSVSLLVLFIVLGSFVSIAQSPVGQYKSMVELDNRTFHVYLKVSEQNGNYLTVIDSPFHGRYNDTLICSIEGLDLHINDTIAKSVSEGKFAADFRTNTLTTKFSNGERLTTTYTKMTVEEIADREELLNNQTNLDSEQLREIKRFIQNSTSDLQLLDGQMLLGYYFYEIQQDSSAYYYQQALITESRLDIPMLKADLLTTLSYKQWQLANYAESYQNLLHASEIVQSPQIGRSYNEKGRKFFRMRDLQDVLERKKVETYQIQGHLFSRVNLEQALSFYLKALRALENIKWETGVANLKMNIGTTYLKMDSLDLSLRFYKEALPTIETDDWLYGGVVYSGIAQIYRKKGDLVLYRDYLLKAIVYDERTGNQKSLVNSKGSYARFLWRQGKYEAAKELAEEILAIAEPRGFHSAIAAAKILLSEYHEKDGEYQLAHQLSREGYRMQRSAQSENQRNLNDFQKAVLDENLRLRDQEKEQEALIARRRTYGLIIGLLLISTIAFLLFRNNRQKQKSNRILDSKKNELETSLATLKSTQAQLIQSEKMASLGELTAGIAHEIQNPLNFVNNFSEVSSELVVEMKEEMDKEDLAEARAISDDLQQNLEKITEHGHRASAIVKNMLQHSRIGSGKKEQIDINALAEEYFNLAFHGMRARDKSFDVTMETDFDKSIEDINVIPQDIGRVLLNLITNAFHACSDRLSKEGAEHDYDPKVQLSTQLSSDSETGQKEVAISITDNGLGIPSEIQKKIFQPFFTTKDTGKGTGLGLSLAYDIVKAHGGKLEVDSKVGQGAVFRVVLPVGLDLRGTISI